MYELGCISAKHVHGDIRRLENEVIIESAISAVHGDIRRLEKFQF